MASTTMIEDRLSSLGIALPYAVAPIANYSPFVITDDLIVISGQISIENGTVIKGKVGGTMSIEEGTQAARICGLNILSHLRAACESIDKTLDDVTRIVRLGGFVNCTTDFYDQPKVINGASDLMVEVFGDVGRHARAAIGVPALPLGAAVEIDATIEVAR